MKILLNIPEELKEKVRAKARENNRSMNKQIIHAIESDLNIINIPLVGAVIDGKMCWQTPQGIEQSR